MNAVTLQNLISDIATELIQRAKTAKADAEHSGSDYDKGRHFAFYEAISLLSQQALAFGVDSREIGLDGFDAERDLL